MGVTGNHTSHSTPVSLSPPNSSPLFNSHHSSNTISSSSSNTISPRSRTDQLKGVYTRYKTIEIMQQLGNFLKKFIIIIFNYFLSFYFSLFFLKFN